METEQRRTRTLRAPRAPQTIQKEISKSGGSAAGAAASAGDGMMSTAAAAANGKPAAAPSQQQQILSRLPPLQPGWKPKAGVLNTVNTTRLLRQSGISPLQYMKQQRIYQRNHTQEAFRKYNAGQYFVQEREERKKEQEIKQQRLKRLETTTTTTTKAIEAAAPQSIEAVPQSTPPETLQPPPKRKDSKARPRKGMIFTLKPVGGCAARKVVMLPQGIAPKPISKLSPVVPVWKGNPSLAAHQLEKQEQQRRAPKQLCMVVCLAIVAVVVVLARAVAWNQLSPIQSASTTTTVEFSPPTVSFRDTMDATSDGLFFYTPVKVIPLHATKDSVADKNCKPLKVIHLRHSVPPMVKSFEVIWLVPKKEISTTLSDKHHRRPLTQSNATTKSLEFGGVILVRLHHSHDLCPLYPISFAPHPAFWPASAAQRMPELEEALRAVPFGTDLVRIAMMVGYAAQHAAPLRSLEERRQFDASLLHYWRSRGHLTAYNRNVEPQVAAALSMQQSALAWAAQAAAQQAQQQQAQQGLLSAPNSSPLAAAAATSPSNNKKTATTKKRKASGTDNTAPGGSGRRKRTGHPRRAEMIYEGPVDEPIEGCGDLSGWLKRTYRRGCVAAAATVTAAQEMVWTLAENVTGSKPWSREQDQQVNLTLLFDSNLTASTNGPSLFMCKLRFEHPRKKRKRKLGKQKPLLLDLNLTATNSPSLFKCKLRLEHPRKKRKRRERREQKPPLLDSNSTTASTNTSTSLFTWKFQLEHPRKKRKRGAVRNSNATTSLKHPRKKWKRKRREHEFFKRRKFEMHGSMKRFVDRSQAGGTECLPAPRDCLAWRKEQKATAETQQEGAVPQRGTCERFFVRSTSST